MANDTQSDAGWNWAVRYIALIVVALILAAAIGSMELFIKTTVFGGKLSASHLVQFMGYGAALAAFGLLAQPSTIALQQHGGRWSFMQHLILPVVSLIAVSIAYTVVLLILNPMMNAALHNIYNWVFIVAILACAVWVLMAVLGESASLTSALTSAAGRIGGSSGKRKS
jgi:hypothetical protein